MCKKIFFYLFSITLLAAFLWQCKSPSSNVATETSDVAATTVRFHNGTKIVRGVNNCPLTAQKIASGNQPPVLIDEPLSNLSVNASITNKETYEQIAKNLPQAHYAFTTLGDLRKQNKHIQIVADSLSENPYHCLISVITPREMAKSRIGGNCR